MRRTCYSFEPSGHRFEPLDILDGVVMRLFCSACSRVVPTAYEHNYEGWDFASLPLGSQVDFMVGNPLVIRKES